MLPPGVQNPPVDAQLGSDHSRLGALHPGHRSTLLLPRPKTIRPLHIRSTHTKTSIPWKWGLSILSQFRGSLQAPRFAWFGGEQLSRFGCAYTPASGRVEALSARLLLAGSKTLPFRSWWAFGG